MKTPELIIIILTISYMILRALERIAPHRGLVMIIKASCEILFVVIIGIVLAFLFKFKHL